MLISPRVVIACSRVLSVLTLQYLLNVALSYVSVHQVHSFSIAVSPQVHRVQLCVAPQ